MKEDFKKNMSFELRRIRNNLGLNLEDVSKKTGYSKMLLSRYENGEIYRIDILLGLLDFYNVRANVFFEKVYTYTYN